MKAMRLDLTSVRCPDALLKARRGVQSLLRAHDAEELFIMAIEPSLSRDLPYAIAHESWPLEFSEQQREIPSEFRDSWANMVLNGEEDIYSDIDAILLFRLIKKTNH